MKEHSTFGVLLRRYRQAAGLSQETLAAQAGLSTRAISDLERGINRNPRSDTLDLLAAALPLTSHQQNLLRTSARPERAAVALPVSPSHGLPLSPTAMIGREQEHTRALTLIRRSQARLLTITGPSGVGKTRFALQVAEDLCEELPDGVSFVALAPVRDAIAWSYELLTGEQQRCFRALGTFVGGWTLPAAEAVCWAEGELRPDEAILTLAALVDASLVQVEMPQAGATRFGILELLRDYALEQLCAAHEEEVCRQRHAAYYAHRGESIAPFGPGQEVDEAELAQDFPNARAALKWAEERHEVELGLRLAVAFGRFWYSHGQMSEAEGWLERTLALDEQVGAPEALLVLRAEALSTLADVLLGLGKLERAEALATEALQRARQSGDQSCMSIAWGILGMAAKAQGKLDEATAWFIESVSHARLTGHLSIDGIALRHRVELAWIQGDLALATTLLEEARLRAQSEGINFVVAGNTNMLGNLAHQQGNYALAKTRYQEALALYRTFSSPTYTSWCLEGLAATLCAEGRFDSATRLYAAAAAVREQALTPLPPAEREAFEQTVARAKVALGGPTFAEEWKAGAALTQEQAIDFALSLDAQV